MDGSDKYIGRILDNRYEILELIGVGGMALVYKALCHRLNRLVAVKILKEDLANDEEFQRRFYTESQAVAMLSHPNIVAVYDVSRSGNTEYIVMELIEGITLKQYINRKGLLNWKEALHFALQITKAISHAHSRGIIHRDIKPHNIMILKDGSVKVADFGIARLLSVQNTLTQEALGSVHYISPEQAKGGQIDARSDIYSVGVVMYEMLTSRLPFIGESAVSVAIQHISAIPLYPRDINPDIPVGLEEITMHAMEPDLNIRFTTAEEMLNDLEEFRKHPGIVFNYTVSNPADRQSTDFGLPYETRRSIPQSGSGTRTDDALLRPERQTPRGTGLKRPKPELTDDEYRDAKTRATSTSTLVGIFSIVVFLVIVIVLMWNYYLRDIFGSDEVEQIVIPNFVNRKYEDIQNNDEYKELYSFNVRYDSSSNTAEGLVMSQNPAEGSRRNPPLSGNRITIELVVSSGDEPPTDMPDLIGLHYVEARNRLVNLNLDLTIELDPVNVDDDSIAIGIVIETVPSASARDNKLWRGNTVVIRYSMGPDERLVRVPDMVGSTRAAVDAAFRDINLDPNFREFEDSALAGTVIFIANAGEEVPVGSRITVHVSLGPPTTEPPTTEAPTTEAPTTEAPTTEAPTTEAPETP